LFVGNYNIFLWSASGQLLNVIGKAEIMS